MVVLCIIFYHHYIAMVFVNYRQLNTVLCCLLFLFSLFSWFFSGILLLNKSVRFFIVFFC